MRNLLANIKVVDHVDTVVRFHEKGMSHTGRGRAIIWADSDRVTIKFPEGDEEVVGLAAWKAWKSASKGIVVFEKAEKVNRRSSLCMTEKHD